MLVVAAPRIEEHAPAVLAVRTRGYDRRVDHLAVLLAADAEVVDRPGVRRHGLDNLHVTVTIESRDAAKAVKRLRAHGRQGRRSFPVVHWSVN